MDNEKLKSAGVSIHVIATGAGAGIQQQLWQTPGSSAYLSGASFPYSAEEQEELLGFIPEHFCSEEAAIDLASAAYMKAYRFGGKKPVGIGIAASVTSNKIHHGEHRIFACAMTDEKVIAWSIIVPKGSKEQVPAFRLSDGEKADLAGLHILDEVFSDSTEWKRPDGSTSPLQTHDVTEFALQRFLLRPFFTANGKRMAKIPSVRSFGDYRHDAWALMPGAFNPPHEGHFGMAQSMLLDHGKSVVFEVTAQPPHKEALSVQQLLQRAKLLQGYNRIFTQKEPYYIDKARAFPGMGMVIGADATVRMLDPKWGFDVKQMLEEFSELHTTFYVGARKIDGRLITLNDILDSLPADQASIFVFISKRIYGDWDISSTELRKKML